MPALGSEAQQFICCLTDNIRGLLVRFSRSANGSQFVTREAYPPKCGKTRIRKGGRQSNIPGVSHSVVTACKSPLVGEDDRASNTTKRGTLEVMNQDGGHVCSKEVVPRVADSYSSLTRFLD